MTPTHDAVSKLWEQTFPAKKEETERLFCTICEQSFYRETGLPLIEVEGKEPVPSVCAFCAIYTKPACVVPAITDAVLSDDVEFMGAWSHFTDALLQWELNARAEYRRLKFKVEETLPAALHNWAMDSLFDYDEQATALRSIWPLLALERILAQHETALCIIETFHHKGSVSAARGAVQRPEVLPVWQLWWATQGNSASRRDWQVAGEQHFKDCHAFSGKDDEVEAC